MRARAFGRLLDVIELLEWVAAESTDARVVERVRAKLEEIDLRVCPECHELYLYITGSRHYRCSNCRWKRQLIRELPGNKKESGKSAAWRHLMAIAEKHNR